ncbi:hypothetical protein [Pseudooceanicola sp.]|uniref:hypothetical protein n=1 Tax=Pseudooceanicola sp. TaxID=1914328 RepID=UPI00260B6461|nr:hypothetical protein [Pseudooceanicola sp.]MDF1856557.1 hypothetical protein [Pseudooceanicola sp.]
MTIDFWGLGLQAVNVLILIWLLSRVLWRPVAAAIAQRQATAREVTEAAAAMQAKADAALVEVTQARAGIAAEQTAALEAARTEAEAAAKLTLDAAHAKADALLAAAKTSIAHSMAEAEKRNAAKASDLSLTIAATLLARLDGPTVQSAFLAQLTEAITKLPPADRAALLAAPDGIEVVTATDPGSDRTAIEQAIRTALEGPATLRFVTDPDLIAGLELRSAHFVLRNSWQADLTQVRKAIKDAA